MVTDFMDLVLAMADTDVVDMADMCVVDMAMAWAMAMDFMGIDMVMGFMDLDMDMVDLVMVH
jgi:hypothetical protein